MLLAEQSRDHQFHVPCWYLMDKKKEEIQLTSTQTTEHKEHQFIQSSKIGMPEITKQTNEDGTVFVEPPKEEPRILFTATDYNADIWENPKISWSRIRNK